MKAPLILNNFFAIVCQQNRIIIRVVAGRLCECDDAFDSFRLGENGFKSRVGEENHSVRHRKFEDGGRSVFFFYELLVQ